MSLPSSATERSPEISMPLSSTAWMICPAAFALTACGRMTSAEQCLNTAGMERSRANMKASSEAAAAGVADTCTAFRTASVPKRALRATNKRAAQTRKHDSRVAPARRARPNGGERWWGCARAAGEPSTCPWPAAGTPAPPSKRDRGNLNPSLPPPPKKKKWLLAASTESRPARRTHKLMAHRMDPGSASAASAGLAGPAQPCSFDTASSAETTTAITASAARNSTSCTKLGRWRRSR